MAEVTDIRHRQIDRIVQKMIPVLEFEDVDLCCEAMGVISAMLAKSILVEFGPQACESFKADFLEISFKHMGNI